MRIKEQETRLNLPEHDDDDDDDDDDVDDDDDDDGKLDYFICRCRWPRGLRHGPATSRLMGVRVRILPCAWMSVSCECLLSGRAM